MTFASRLKQALYPAYRASLPLLEPIDQLRLRRPFHDGFQPLETLPSPEDVRRLLAKRDEGDLLLTIPRSTTLSGVSLQRTLLKPGQFDRFQRAIWETQKLPRVGKHLSRLECIHRDGSYVSEAVHGESLSAIMANQLANHCYPSEFISKVLSQCATLEDDLEAFQSAGGALRGSWTPADLVYDETRNRIINTNLHSIFTTPPGKKENDLGYLRQRLARIQTFALMNPGQRHRLINVLRALDYARSEQRPSGHQSLPTFGPYWEAGYQSVRLGELLFVGQRDCDRRLQNIPFDFEQKSVLDIGCNVGGMLHALAGKIRRGTGIDYDAKCINAASLVSGYNGTGHLSFFTFDLEKDRLGLLDTFLDDGQVDLCLFLAVGLWVRTWRETMRFVAARSKAMLLEAHGSPSQQAEQVSAARQAYQEVRLIAASSADDDVDKTRQLYLCTVPVER